MDKTDENSDVKIEFVNDNDNNDNNDNDIDIDILHKGKPIFNIQVTPKEEYLITCGRDGSIVGWDVEKVNEGQRRLKSKFKIYPIDTIQDDRMLYGGIFSDNKKAVTFGHECHLRAYDMNNDKLQKNELDLNYDESNYCAFNLNNELISYYKGSRDNKGIIFIYSTQTKDNEWNCERIYKVPEYLKVNEDFRIISISKYNKLYFMLSKNSIYEFDLITEKCKKIWVIEKKLRSNFGVKIVSNENLVGLKIWNKIIIYSVKLEILVVSLDTYENVKQLRMLMKHPVSCSLLLPLLLSLFSYESSNKFWNSIMENFWIKCIDHLNQNDKSVKLPNNYVLINIRVTSKYAFIILDVGIWRIDLEKIISSINSLLPNKLDEKKFEDVDNLHILLHDSYMDTIRKLFNEVILNFKPIDYETKSQNSFKWTLSSNKNFKMIGLRISSLNNYVICERYEKIKLDVDQNFLGIKLLNESDIIILTKIGLFIYHYNKDNTSISLIYYYYMKLSDSKQLRYYEKEFSSHTDLPLPNNTSFKSCDEWVLDVRNNKERFLKYGVGLLTFAIEEHNVKLVDDIYKNCIKYFKEDFNINILSIITSKMHLLNKHYPEFIERYSLETAMVIDSPSYSLVHINDNLHLFSFEYPQMDNLSRSLLYYKYQLFKSSHKKVANVLKFIQYLLISLLLPFYFAIFYILSKFNYFNNIITKEIYYSTLYFKIFSKYEKTLKIPTLVFLNPYIKFVNYPTNKNWISELFWPNPSPFVETINSDIYKTWNGESLINFKWNTYGKYYYTVIWILFMAFLGCFTVATTIPQQYISNDIQKQLLIASVILGFIHLNFEIRQIIYDPIKWISNIWNIFDIIAFLLPIYTSINWLQTNSNRDIQLLSFTCLFLDIKFLLFFRVFESFGIYFAIIISVGKQIISFLMVLLIIIISFAHALYILLSPKNQYSFDQYTNDNDPNNPWNIASTYHQAFENGTFDSNPYIIQQPDGNTNMFINFRTALFAMYLFLTGDSSALTNWSYIDNPSLAIMIVLFSLLIVVYLMNLFIGLLNIAIEKDNNRVSYLIQKAEILAEIELFYLLPIQRRWKAWFPEVIYYYANADKTREKIKELIKNDEWKSNKFSKLKKGLLKELRIEHESVDEENEN